MAILGALENLIPTVTGTAGTILGGLGGGIAGAAIPGADVTGVPEVAGAIAGGGAGGSIGSGFGQGIENLLQGRPWSNNVASQAVKGGVAGLLGEGSGQVLKAAATPTSNILGGLGSKLFAGQFNSAVPEGIDQQGVANSLYNMGVTNAKHIQPIANAVTGRINGTGALTKLVDSAVAKNGTTDTTGIVDMAKSLLNSTDGMAVSAKQGKTFVSNVTKSLSNIPTIGDNVGSNGIEAQSEAKNLMSLGSQAYNKGVDEVGRVTNPEQAALGKLYTNVAKEINDRVVAPLTPELKQEAINNLASIKSINPTVYENLVKQVQGAQTTADAKALQRPWVQASQSMRASTGADAAGHGSSARPLLDAAATIAPSVLGGPLGVATSAAGIGDLLTGGALSRGVLSGVQKGGAALAGGLAGGSPVADAALKLGTAGIPQAAANIGSLQTAPATPGSNNFLGGLPVNPSAQPGTPATAAGVTPNVNPNNAAQVEALLAAQYDPQLLSSIAPGGLTGIFAPQAKAAQATSVLTGLLQSFNAAGGAQGAVQGTLSKMAGKVSGNAAANYEQQKAAAAAQIAQATGQPVQQVLDQLPDITMNKTQAAQALATVQGLLGSIGGTGSPGVLSGMNAGAAQ